MRLNISEIYWNGFTHPSGKEPLEKVWKGEAIGEKKKTIRRLDCLLNSKRSHQQALCWFKGPHLMSITSP